MPKISFQNDVLPLKNQLYRLALRITLRNAEAEDIVQETLIKAWNVRDKWDTIDNIEAFCFTICRNLALDSIKRHDNRNETLENVRTDTPDTHGTPLERTTTNDRLAIVRHLVDSLPEKQRTCIQLRDFEGKTYKEIAAIIGVPEEQVKVNIFRGRQAIKTQFQKLDNYVLEHPNA
jgi:RNA polymerase sigma factor (sigma-70 family)